MKDYYLLTKEQILAEFGVTLQGHTKERAQTILKEKGENVIHEGKKKSIRRAKKHRANDLKIPQALSSLHSLLCAFGTDFGCNFDLYSDPHWKCN